MLLYGPAVLRLAVGSIFVAHGAQKLFGVWGGGGLAGTAGFFAGLGLTPAYPLAILAGVVEFAGGTMLIAGALTRFAALALIVNMAIAVWKVHLVNGFFLNWNLVAGQGHGYEFNLVLTGALASLVITGAGALSIDGQRARSAESRSYGRARLRAGHV
ncbi:MAG: DoxX family protein [Acidobacteriota bacterium]|nr:DoxX family protein [Acidobacteriota bacterium]